MVHGISIKVKNVIFILYFVSFIVDEHTIKLASDRLKQYGKTIKDKLKRKMDVVLEITDNFIECGLLDIDGLEEILHSQKEPAEVLVEFVIRNLHLGTYNLLLKTLESDKHFRSLVSDLNTAGVSDDKKTGTLYYYN